MPGRVTLDDVDMWARLRPLRHAGTPTYVSRPVPEPARKLFQDVSVVQDFVFPSQFVRPAVEPQTAPVQAATPQPVQMTSSRSVVGADVVPLRQTFPAVPHKPEPSRVLRREAFKSKPAEFARDLEPVFKVVTPRPELHRTFDPPPKVQRIRLPKLRKNPLLVVLKVRRVLRAMPRQQRALTALAAIVLLVGSGISLQQLRANHLGGIGAAKAGIAAAVPATTTNSNSTPPSTATVTGDTLKSYQVAPDAARYIQINKLGVLARVLQVGTTKTGALATPSNVYDAAWYKASAKPGDPGATLIDGHVSSWTTNGVFYGIKNLVAGDNIEIIRGDGKKLDYTVVKTIAYPVDAVDMDSLMKPVTAGKSGLNLITCGGKYDSKSGEFTERIAVYATLND